MRALRSQNSQDNAKRNATTIGPYLHYRCCCAAARKHTEPSGQVLEACGSIQTAEFTLFTKNIRLVSLLNVTDVIQNLEKYKTTHLNFSINVYGYVEIQY